MSVLKSLKGTIQSVQQDLSSSIKSLTTSKEKSSQQKIIKKTKVQSHHGINLDAGADLLHRHQENWSELHTQAEENANKAENLAVVIETLFVTLDKQAESMSQMCEEVKVLPGIIQQLQELTNHIASVEELCEQVEAAAIQLENICDIQDFQKAKLGHRYQLATYKEKKKTELDRFKVQLAQEHAKKVKVKDVKKKHQLKERQSIFQEAFDKDINYYRTFGHTERQPSTESNEAVDLSEVTIEEDPDALDDFLASSDVTPSGDRPLVFAGDEVPEEESDSGVMNDREESPDPGQTSPSPDESHKTQSPDKNKDSAEDSSNIEAIQTLSKEQDDSSKQASDEGGGPIETANTSDIPQGSAANVVEEPGAKACHNTDENTSDLRSESNDIQNIPESSSIDNPSLANEIALVDELQKAGDSTIAESNQEPDTKETTEEEEQ